MTENSTTQSVPKRRKKTSKLLFSYTGKEYHVKSGSAQKPAADQPSDSNVLHQAAAAWVDVIREAGRPMDRDECLAALAAKDTGTSQPPIRIIYYWKKYLIDGGWISISKKDAKAKVEVTPAPVAPASA